MDLKTELKNRRKELGLTMLDVAKKVGVSEGTISRWESGDIANMRRDKIVLLAKALEVTPSFIMDCENDSLKETNYEYITERFLLSPIQEKLLSNCQQLNDLGQKKILDFSEDLISSNNYTATERYSIAAYGAVESEENFQLPDEEITT